MTSRATCKLQQWNAMTSPRTTRKLQQWNAMTSPDIKNVTSKTTRKLQQWNAMTSPDIKVVTSRATCKLQQWNAMTSPTRKLQGHQGCVRDPRRNINKSQSMHPHHVQWGPLHPQSVPRTSLTFTLDDVSRRSHSTFPLTHPPTHAPTKCAKIPSIHA